MWQIVLKWRLRHWQCGKFTELIPLSFPRRHYLPDSQLHFQHNWVRSWFQQKWFKKKVLPALFHWVYSWRRRSRGAPLSKILHASSFICGCSSCPVSSTVTPEHSAAAKHLAPSPTVQMKNKHNLPFWVSSKWGISWQIEGWFIMQRQKRERGAETKQGNVVEIAQNCVVLFMHLNYMLYGKLTRIYSVGPIINCPFYHMTPDIGVSAFKLVQVRTRHDVFGNIRIILRRDSLSFRKRGH